MSKRNTRPMDRARAKAQHNIANSVSGKRRRKHRPTNLVVVHMDSVKAWPVGRRMAQLWDTHGNPLTVDDATRNGRRWVNLTTLDGGTQCKLHVRQLLQGLCEEQPHGD